MIYEDQLWLNSIEDYWRFRYAETQLNLKMMLGIFLIENELIFILFDSSLKMRPSLISFSLPEGFNYVFQFSKAFLFGSIYLPEIPYHFKA